MNIIITEHAKERLGQRLQVSKRKMYKVVEKAWKSTNRFSNQLNKSEYKKEVYTENAVYRELMGFVFVFVMDEENPVLITVYH